MRNKTHKHKHFLYGTTALATAGMISGVAVNAVAAERIDIGVHGYFQQWMVGAKQHYDNNALSGAQRSTNLVTEKHNSEICFVGEATLDNGITFGVNVQLEANTSGDQIDESYLFVQSDSLGQLILGDLDNAASLLHVTAPDGGVSLDSGDVINNEFYVNPGLTLFDRATGTTFLQFGDDDSGKINYVSPRFSGVQLGVSFIPQFQAGGDNNGSLKLNNGNGNNINNGFAGGINYTEDFNGFGVQLSAGYLFGDTGADSVTGGNDNLNAYDFGAQFNYAGFSFGGAYNRGAGDDGFNTRFNSRSWIVGANYETGPYTVGVNYMKGEENPTSNSGKGHLDQAVLSGTYQLGPGVRLVGGVFWFDGENEDNSQKNNGWGATAGFKLGF
jgi:hypothetical protein